MRNTYQELFCNITAERWKQICDTCLISSNISLYFNITIPKNIISYYNKKFSYKCPLDGHSKDQRGKKFGKLTVIDFAGRNNRKQIMWKCQCECGNIENHSGVLLRDKTFNHMCSQCRKIEMSQRKLKDLTGKTFNFLHVDQRIGSRSNSGLALYQCTCLNCGNKVNVSSGALTRKYNPQISCGCVISAGEYKLNLLLQDLNIEYKTQYKFADCKYKNLLKFDFAIFQNDVLKCLIEFQGKQHYTLTNGNWNDTQQAFQQRQLRDNIKRDYCKQKNIPLIEISYKDLNKLSLNYLKDILTPYYTF